VPFAVPEIKYGDVTGDVKYPINIIPKLHKNRKTINTKITKANLAIIVFESKNSELPSTKVLEENSFNDDLTDPTTSDVRSATLLYADVKDCLPESNTLDADSDNFFALSERVLIFIYYIM
jgi:hypothetical protein